MKQSWVIGIISLWLVIFTSEMIATGGTAFSNQNDLNVLASPAFVNQSGVVAAASAIMNGIATFFVSFVQIIFLWSPTVFAGNWIWFWEFICLPIAISFIVVIATILRGVHAS
jgi:hypothetical protein